MHRNTLRGRGNHVPMPPGSDLYLEAFTRFVLAGKSDGDREEQDRAARDKAHALGEMLDMTGVVPEGQHRQGPRHSPARRAA